MLDVAPAALENLSHAYNPDYGTLDTRDNSTGSTSPEVIVCQVLAAAGKVQRRQPAGAGRSTGGARPRCRRRPRPSAPGCSPVTRTPTAQPDDLNHNGVPDLQELVGAIYGSRRRRSAPERLRSPGCPAVTGGN